MATTNVSDLVRRYFAAYETKDRQVVDNLLSPDFTFTGPRGAQFRNAEVVRAQGDKIIEVDVYFGRTLKPSPQEEQ